MLFRSFDRSHRSRRDDPLDRHDRDPRDKRERDDDRERLYRRRGDPRGSIDELPYGDEKPSSVRRRRADSDLESGGSKRDTKVRRFLKTMPDVSQVRPSGLPY